MQSKDVVLQVSRETAAIMNDISDQLFNDTDNRFNEIAEDIDSSVKKLENLYSDFITFTVKSENHAQIIKSEVTDKFQVMLKDLGRFQTENSVLAEGVSEKCDQIIAVMSGVPQLIQAVSKDISGTSEKTLLFESNILEEITRLSDSLTHVKKIHGELIQDLNDNSIEINTKILNETATINRLTENLDNFKDILDQLTLSMSTSKIHDEKLFTAVNHIFDLSSSFSDQYKLSEINFSENLDKIFTCFNNLSLTVGTIADKQLEISFKQEVLEQEIKYIKLPFYKKWFTKGK